MVGYESKTGRYFFERYLPVFSSLKPLFLLKTVWVQTFYNSLEYIQNFMQFFIETAIV